jgi:hypothetical protein
MRRPVLLVAVALGVVVAACGGPKKHSVDRQELQSVSDHIDKEMRSASASPEDRRAYAVVKLGAPHRVDGDVQYWYTPQSNCFYFQLGADGWASWGPGVTEDCKSYAVVK